MLQVTQQNAMGVINAMESNGYQVFVNDTRNYNLNIVGVRNPNQNAGTFDDTMFVFWKYAGKWNFRSYAITTDPGRRALESGGKDGQGATILQAGNYRGAYAIAQGRNGPYLQQVMPVTVIRDGNRDQTLDFDSGQESDEMAGINIIGPRDGSFGGDREVWTYGAQAFRALTDWQEFLGLCEKAAVIYGNNFTYTLLEEVEVV